VGPQANRLALRQRFGRRPRAERKRPTVGAKLQPVREKRRERAAARREPLRIKQEFRWVDPEIVGDVEDVDDESDVE
jgi:hypothetical protein